MSNTNPSALQENEPSPLQQLLRNVTTRRRGCPRRQVGVPIRRYQPFRRAAATAKRHGNTDSQATFEHHNDAAVVHRGNERNEAVVSLPRQLPNNDDGASDLSNRENKDSRYVDLSNQISNLTSSFARQLTLINRQFDRIYEKFEEHERHFEQIERQFEMQNDRTINWLREVKTEIESKTTQKIDDLQKMFVNIMRDEKKQPFSSFFDATQKAPYNPFTPFRPEPMRFDNLYSQHPGNQTYFVQHEQSPFYDLYAPQTCNQTFDVQPTKLVNTPNTTSEVPLSINSCPKLLEVQFNAIPEFTGKQNQNPVTFLNTLEDYMSEFNQTSRQKKMLFQSKIKTNDVSFQEYLNTVKTYEEARSYFLDYYWDKPTQKSVLENFKKATFHNLPPKQIQKEVERYLIMIKACDKLLIDRKEFLNELIQKMPATWHSVFYSSNPKTEDDVIRLMKSCIDREIMYPGAKKPMEKETKEVLDGRNQAPSWRNQNNPPSRTQTYSNQNNVTSSNVIATTSPTVTTAISSNNNDQNHHLRVATVQMLDRPPLKPFLAHEHGDFLLFGDGHLYDIVTILGKTQQPLDGLQSTMSIEEAMKIIEKYDIEKYKHFLVSLGYTDVLQHEVSITNFGLLLHQFYDKLMQKGIEQIIFLLPIESPDLVQNREMHDYLSQLNEKIIRTSQCYENVKVININDENILDTVKFNFDPFSNSFRLVPECVKDLKNDIKREITSALNQCSKQTFNFQIGENSQDTQAKLPFNKIHEDVSAVTLRNTSPMKSLHTADRGMRVRKAPDKFD